MMSKSILVLGGLGFIGKALVRQLAPHNVTVVDIADPQVILPGVTYVGVPLGALASQVDLSKFDVIYHLASSALPNRFLPTQDIQQDLAATVDFLEALPSNGALSQFIFLSSGGAVYGPSKLPITEDGLVAPKSSYGVVKSAIEYYIQIYAQQKGFNGLIIRPSNVYGPGLRGDRAQNVIYVFLKRILNNLPLEIWGDGSAKKDYLFIDDLIACLIKAINHQKSDVFNVASGYSVSLLDVVNVIQEVTNSSPNLNFLQMKATDPQSVLLSIEKIKTELDWMPGTSLEQGIRATWNDLL